MEADIRHEPLAFTHIHEHMYILIHVNTHTDMHAHYTHINTGKKMCLQRYTEIDSSTCTVQWNLHESNCLKL